MIVGGIDTGGNHEYQIKFSGNSEYEPADIESKSFRIIKVSDILKY